MHMTISPSRPWSEETKLELATALRAVAARLPSWQTRSHEDMMARAEELEGSVSKAA